MTQTRLRVLGARVVKPHGGGRKAKALQLEQAEASLAPEEPFVCTPPQQSPPRELAPPAGRPGGRPPAGPDPGPGTPPPLVVPLPFSAARPYFPAPACCPPDCSTADTLVGRLGEQYMVLDAKFGRGLFLKQGVKAGALIARYSGERLTTRTLPPAEERPRTHMLRVPGSHDIIDGRPLADRLARSRPGRGKAVWTPGQAADLYHGYASLANAAGTEGKANVRMLFVPDDLAVEGVRPAGYDAAAAPVRLHRDLVDLLPRGAYLVAKTDLPPNTEILWHYQWVKE